MSIHSVAAIERSVASAPCPMQRMAQHGAELAKGTGFETEGLAMADDLETPAAETLTDVADERDAQGIVVGAHGRRGLSTVILGSTLRDAIRRSTRPVVVVRQP